MNLCMNVLYEPEVFLPSASLTVLILLVWAQLAQPIRPPNDGKYRKATELARSVATQLLGFMWIFFAILLALASFAMYVVELKQLAIALLSWSVLMTFVHVLLSLLIRFCQFVFDIPQYKSQAGELTCCKKWLLFAFAFTFLIGLGLISFEVLGFLTPIYLWIGIHLLIIGSIGGVCVCVFSKWNHILWHLGGRCIWRRRAMRQSNQTQRARCIIIWHHILQFVIIPVPWLRYVWRGIWHYIRDRCVIIWRRWIMRHSNKTQGKND